VRIRDIRLTAATAAFHSSDSEPPTTVEVVKVLVVEAKALVEPMVEVEANMAAFDASGRVSSVWIAVFAVCAVFEVSPLDGSELPATGTPPTPSAASVVVTGICSACVVCSICTVCV
jgi:hypothetical protein